MIMIMMTISMLIVDSVVIMRTIGGDLYGTIKMQNRWRVWEGFRVRLNGEAFWDENSLQLYSF